MKTFTTFILLLISSFACFATTSTNNTASRDTIIIAEYTGKDFMGSCLTHFKDKAGNEYTFYDADLSTFKGDDGMCGMKEAFQNDTYELTCTYEKQAIYLEDVGDTEYEGWVIKGIKTHSK